MPYCCTWLIVLACWLLHAPSFGTFPHSISSGLAALFLATTSSCCPNSHNSLLLYSVSLLVPVNLPLCFSLLPSALTCNSSVCVVDPPTLALNSQSAFLSSNSEPLLSSPCSSSSSSTSPSSVPLPLTVPSTASLSHSVGLWQRNLEKTAVPHSCVQPFALFAFHFSSILI